MNDEFDRLRDLPAPPSDGAAKARAISMAMQAFDDAQNVLPQAQGNEKPKRQSSIINQIWSAMMNKQLLAGSALATLLIVPLAGILTVQFMQQNFGQLPGSTLEEPAKPVAALPVVVDQSTSADARSADKNQLQEEFAVDALKAKKDIGPAVTAPKPAMTGLVQKQESAVRQDVVRSEALPMSAAPAPMETMADVAVPPQAERVDAAGLQARETDQNRFSDNHDNPVKSVAAEPVSTFSVDVDTASYSFVRRDLMAGVLPQPDEVRSEEMVNYFPYDWPAPKTAETPFASTITVTPTPWNANTKLMHIGIKGYDVVRTEQPKANLVFLIDVSGSMDEEAKLSLLKSAFRLLVDTLKPDDTVSIVTYAGNSGVVLEPTKASDKARILQAIDTLQPGGSTAGAAGLQTAYQLAEKTFIKDGINRVMLATDGDFNVGQSSDEELKQLIEAKRKSGVFLSVLGFGHDNYNDQMMQVLAQNGNGTAAFIDTLAEAQKTLVEEAGAELFPIAKDVKIQVEFNPQKIAEYRLIGYETRALNREDFNNDKVDAGDIGSGHRVTAIYEVTPVGSPAILNDDLRYGSNVAKPREAAVPSESAGNELAFVKIRYKKPDEDKSKLISTAVTDANSVASIGEASSDVRFSVAVAAFAQKLRHNPVVSDYSFGSILDLANNARGSDSFGYRSEFVKLVQMAKGLSGNP